MAKNISQHIHRVNPYEGLELMDLDEQGWNSTGESFKAAIEATNARTIIEVGTWKGGSALTMAAATKELGYSNQEVEIVCIDTFLGSWEHHTSMASFLQPGNGEKKFGRPTIYEQFLSNVIRKEYTDVITPFPIDSFNGALCLEKWQVKADLIYVDAGHDYDSVFADFKLYQKVLRDGGMILIDDWHHGPIKDAAKAVFGDTIQDYYGKAVWTK